ncbi:MAG: hypothetical protein U5M53_10865 [Rhodoferax sp.]|nr:hypothetical protein [Rhodoferax sp.]
MPELPSFSTDGLGSPLFPPHGRAQWRFDGQVLRSDVVGPFNKELAQLVGPVLREAFAYLVARGPCAELVVIRKSAMAGPDVLAALAQGLGQLVQARLTPCATAFVMGPEVEGHQVMPMMLKRSYAAAGWPAFQVFETEAEAEVWLQAQLAAA